MLHPTNQPSPMFTCGSRSTPVRHYVLDSLRRAWNDGLARGVSRGRATLQTPIGPVVFATDAAAT